jgi:hypothetical protein
MMREGLAVRQEREAAKAAAAGAAAGGGAAAPSSGGFFAQGVSPYSGETIVPSQESEVVREAREARAAAIMTGTNSSSGEALPEPPVSTTAGTTSSSGAIWNAEEVPTEATATDTTDSTVTTAAAAADVDSESEAEAEAYAAANRALDAELAATMAKQAQVMAARADAIAAEQLKPAVAPLDTAAAVAAAVAVKADVLPPLPPTAGELLASEASSDVPAAGAVVGATNFMELD